MTRLKETATKYLYKAAWSSISYIKKKPIIEVLHHRDIPGEPANQYEFVHKCIGPAYLEPKWGYLITEQGALIEEPLLSPWKTFNIKPWQFAMPSPIDFLQTRKAHPERIVKYPRVLSLRFLWEWNYFHFYVDVLGKLNLLDSLGFTPDMPLIVGRYAIELPFVQQIMTTGNLKNWNWVVQDNTFICADEIIYCRTKQSFRHRMDYLLDQMYIPETHKEGEDRVFLTRGKSATRRILNNEEVEKIVAEYGFRIVDTDGMPIAEQIDLFSNTRYLIGIHGAGLINIIYRRGGPFSLLELTPKNYLADYFETICSEYKYNWELLTGEPDDNSGQHSNFTLSTTVLRQKIEKMLADPSKSQHHYATT